MAGRMAADRMARGRGCPDQILALDTAGRHALAEARRHGKTALAHRTRLPRPEAGDRPRSLRRSRVARVPPPRGALDRGLRIPRRREESDSPLCPAHPGAPAPDPAAGKRLPSARCRSDLNAIPRTPSTIRRLI